MRYVVSYLAVMMIACFGCRCGGPTVNANMNGHVVTEMPAVPNVSSVVPMEVPGGCDAECGPRIAIIDVDGILLNYDLCGSGSLGENPVSIFRERLDAALADPHLCGVVIRINSYGGGVTATDVMWHDLVSFKQQKRVPVIACVMDTGTGGAYYLATAADQIIAHPTSVVGGIGVIFNRYNLSGALNDTYHLTNETVRAKQSPHIDTGTNVAREIETGGKSGTEFEAETGILRTVSDEYHDRFRNVVLEARARVNPQDETNFDGRIFSGQQALQRQLIDQLGYMDDAVETVRNLTNCQAAVPVMYHRTNDRARTVYSVTPNIPLQTGIMPSVPGLDRTKLPTFLYMWQPEPTMEKLGGH